MWYSFRSKCWNVCWSLKNHLLPFDSLLLWKPNVAWNLFSNGAFPWCVNVSGLSGGAKPWQACLWVFTVLCFLQLWEYSAIYWGISADLHIGASGKEVSLVGKRPNGAQLLPLPFFTAELPEAALWGIWESKIVVSSWEKCSERISACSTHSGTEKCNSSLPLIQPLKEEKSNLAISCLDKLGYYYWCVLSSWADQTRTLLNTNAGDAKELAELSVPCCPPAHAGILSTFTQ